MDSLLLIILAVALTAIFANFAFALGEDSREDFGLRDATFLS
jgi:hypothetical protein